MSFFPEHHIIFRTNGIARHFRLTTIMQLTSVSLITLVAIASITVYIQSALIVSRADYIHKSKIQLEKLSKKVRSLQSNLNDQIVTLEQRQQLLHNLMESNLQSNAPSSNALSSTTMIAQASNVHSQNSAPGESAAEQARKHLASYKASDTNTGFAPRSAWNFFHTLSNTFSLKARDNNAPINQKPPQDRTQRVENQQLVLARSVQNIVDRQINRNMNIIKRLGLSTNRLQGQTAVGGPFIALKDKGTTQKSDPSSLLFQRLAQKAAKLQRLEAGMLSVPAMVPTKINRINSRFGTRRDPLNRGYAFHSGIDIKGSHGQPVYSSAQGRIVYAGYKGAYGYTIDIDHGLGLITRYGHLSKIHVNIGQQVKQGALIGRMGSTGRSTGTHLHFEVRVDGKAVNPQKYLKESANVMAIQKRARQQLATRG